jgi:hypothetical protein
MRTVARNGGGLKYGGSVAAAYLGIPDVPCTITQKLHNAKDLECEKVM